MKSRIARIACLALIIAGVFFTTGRAEAKIFARSSSTGCMAPANGNAIGVCSQPGEKAAVTVVPPPAPKHWHYHPHWHWHYCHHFRFHRSYHHSGSHFHHHH